LLFLFLQGIKELLVTECLHKNITAIRLAVEHADREPAHLQFLFYFIFLVANRFETAVLRCPLGEFVLHHPHDFVEPEGTNQLQAHCHCLKTPWRRHINTKQNYSPRYMLKKLIKYRAHTFITNGLLADKVT
jgi:hypothetical protein